MVNHWRFVAKPSSDPQGLRDSPALLEHRRLPRLLRVEDLLGRPADLRPEQLPNLEAELPAELMREEDTLCDMVPLLSVQAIPSATG